MNKYEKARLLVDQGRVLPVIVTKDYAVYKVIGDTEVHTVIWDGKRWSCDCKWFALHPDIPCSHILAAQRMYQSVH